jgi:uncharacterized membrane protein
MSIRHRESTRLEGFSDAVFGFALTLLVVSLETPRTFDELKTLLLQFAPFALTFAMVCWIWYEHNLFFRRYGLQDALTVFINCVLLFVVLFYVYPLKFLTSALVGGVLMRQDNAPGIATDADGRLLMLLYSLGVLSIFLTFIALHWHAWRQRTVLGLDPREELQLRYRARSHGISAGLAVVSLAMIWLMPRQMMWAGLIYSLMGPLHALNGYSAARAQAALARS